MFLIDLLVMPSTLIFFLHVYLHFKALFFKHAFLVRVVNDYRYVCLGRVR